MQQRQLRLGDILDDYCPRERRVTNHVIVAMIAEDVKQVRCTTCDADHDFKHAKVPRQRRKTETPAALYAQVLSTGPKRVTHESAQTGDVASAGDGGGAAEDEPIDAPAPAIEAAGVAEPEPEQAQDPDEPDANEDDGDGRDDEGPVHRPLIRASLPKIDGAPPPSRQIPEFTIRQPAGRPTNRFRPRHQRGGVGGGGGQQFPGNRSHGGGNVPGTPRGGMRSNGGRPPQGPGGAQARRHGPGRKRSK
jgi:hypothetical protein